nr:putative capsid protein [Cressdnaviricota sp.]
MKKTATKKTTRRKLFTGKPTPLRRAPIPESAMAKRVQINKTGNVEKAMGAHGSAFDNAYETMTSGVMPKDEHITVKGKKRTFGDIAQTATETLLDMITKPETMTAILDKVLGVSYPTSGSTVNLGNDKIFHYRKVFETGAPPSKALRILAKQNGVTTKTIFDTKTAKQSESNSFDFLSRKMLTTGTGFNQRGMTYFGSNSFIDIRDILFNINANPIASAKPEGYQTILASVLRSRCDFLMRNQSALHKAMVRVMVFKYKNSNEYPTADSVALLESCLWPNTTLGPDDPTVDDKRDKVVYMYQYNNPRIETLPSNTASIENKIISVDYTTKGQFLKSSTRFRKSFELVHSHTQTLGPGDFYGFSHVHNYGPGVNVMDYLSETTSITQFDTPDLLLPSSYVVMFEYKGSQCECTYNNGQPTEQYEQHIGSAPVTLSFEMRKKLTYVNEDLSGADTGTQGFTPNCHVRVFIKQNPDSLGTKNKEFNLNLEKWVGSTVPAAGFFGITSSTERAFSATTHQAGNAANTDITP